MNEDSEKVAGMAIMSMARDIDELKAEIEGLRRENEQLRISVADFKQCAEAAHRATDERDAEIERLREENSTLSDSLATKADRIDRLGETVVRLLQTSFG